ncbi:LacI family DNA-binding transcriptional regulator [Marinoscillum luteum]|uniref:LacI family DNA-binding transcriptional regulator n=1 Tax=Marinoscillum luteum TaxID=861051 RepID=A0ABW7NBX1_9BACT
MIDKKNIRIKDIAQMAGVSVGTVDRVLHGRGKVSKDAQQKVEDVLNRTGYKPNLIARTLGSNKTLKITALLPDPAQDDYWALAEAGILQSIEEWSYYDVEINCIFFDLYNPGSFKTTTDVVLESKPDGILIAPVFHHESIELLAQLKAHSIPYVLFNTNIPEADPLCFIGQNLVHSGKVAGELLSLAGGTRRTIMSLHIYENRDNSVHLMAKEHGLRQYFQEQPYEVISLDLSTPHEVEDHIREAILNPDLLGIFVTTSKGTYIVAQILEKYSLEHIRLVGYDLLEENLRYLKKGTIDFLINQNPKRMAKIGVNHLVNHLLFQKTLPEKEIFPIEIITRQNLDSYLTSRIH